MINGKHRDGKIYLSGTLYMNDPYTLRVTDSWSLKNGYIRSGNNGCLYVSMWDDNEEECFTRQ